MDHIEFSMFVFSCMSWKDYKYLYTDIWFKHEY